MRIYMSESASLRLYERVYAYVMCVHKGKRSEAAGVCKRRWVWVRCWRRRKSEACNLTLTRLCVLCVDASVWWMWWTWWCVDERQDQDCGEQSSCVHWGPWRPTARSYWCKLPFNPTAFGLLVLVLVFTPTHSTHSTHSTVDTCLYPSATTEESSSPCLALRHTRHTCHDISSAFVPTHTCCLFAAPHVLPRHISYL
jgi:hypothetical protein